MRVNKEDQAKVCERQLCNSQRTRGVHSRELPELTFLMKRWSVDWVWWYTPLISAVEAKAGGSPSLGLHCKFIVPQLTQCSFKAPG